MPAEAEYFGPTRRLMLGALIVLVGVPVALVFGAGSVGMCLGPVGVTAVECAKVTGQFPTVGLGLPMLAATLVLAMCVLVPVARGDWLRIGASAAAGGVLGGILFLRQPQTLEGFDSHGQWLSLPRPLDETGLVTAVAPGAALGFALVRLVFQVRRRRG